MPPPKTTNEFLELLERSCLVPAAQLKTALHTYRDARSAKDSISSLAGFLIGENLITKFHADQLRAGRHKGFMVGKYKILKLLGSGGMGRVYLAEHQIMRREVALKVLPKAKSAEPSALARFQREARAVAALNDPNIIQAYDIDHDGDLHYIVMEYVEGKTIQDYIKELGAIPWPMAADIICQTARGLAHANASGLVHRDIKPGNLLLDGTGTVKLLDMGLAVFCTEKDRDSLTVDFNENVLGTADYLAPEQALDSHNVDIRADIYSLGGTFYYMMTERAPFPEGTIAQKLLWHQSKEPTPASEMVPDLPNGLQQILHKMMAKKPAERFPTPEALEAELLPYAVHVNRPFDLDAVEQTIEQSRVREQLRRRGTLGDNGVRSSAMKPASVAGSAGLGVRTGRPSRSARDGAEAPWLPAEAPSKRAANDRNKNSRNSDGRQAPARPSQGGTTPQDSDATVRIGPMLDPNLIASDDDELPVFGKAAEETAAKPGSTAVADVSLEVIDDDASATDSRTDFLTSISGGPSRQSSLVLGSATGPQSTNWWPILAAVFVIAGLTAYIWVTALRDDAATITTDPAQSLATGQPAERLTSDPTKVIEIPTRFHRLIDEGLYAASRGQTVKVKKNPDGWNQTTLNISPGRIEGAGIILEGADAGIVVTATSSTDGKLLVIEQTSEFVVRNLILDGGGMRGPVIEIRGNGVDGVALENVTVRNFSGEGIRLVGANAANEPVHLRNVTVEISHRAASGICFRNSTDAETSKESSGVEMTGCTIIGKGVLFVSGVVFEQPVRNVSFERGTFTNGRIGIDLLTDQPDWADLELIGNRFEKLQRWAKAPSPKSLQTITMRKNDFADNVTVKPVKASTSTSTSSAAKKAKKKAED